MSDTLSQRVIQVCADFTGMDAREIHDNSSMRMITKCDSNDEARFIIALQNEFGIELDGPAIEEFPCLVTVGNLKKFVADIVKDNAFIATGLAANDARSRAIKRATQVETRARRRLHA